MRGAARWFVPWGRARGEECVVGGGGGGGRPRLQRRDPLVTPHLTRFLLRMRGAFTAAPMMEEPVMKIPHAAPTMHSARPSATPVEAKRKGLMLFNTCPQPALLTPG